MVRLGYPFYFDVTEEPTPTEETPAAPDEAAPDEAAPTTDDPGDPTGIMQADYEETQADLSEAEPEAVPEETEPPATAEEAEAPELDSEGESIPETHTAYHGAPEGYELPTRLPEALEAERLAAEPPPVEPDEEPAPGE